MIIFQPVLLYTFLPELSDWPLLSLSFSTPLWLPHTLSPFVLKNLSRSFTSASFFLSGIRSPWNLPRLCSSWWRRRACPACLPAWERFTPATATQMASSTSPTPHRRCSERLNQRPGRPAEPEADKKNELNPDQWWRQTEPSQDVCFLTTSWNLMDV